MTDLARPGDALPSIVARLEAKYGLAEGLELEDPGPVDLAGLPPTEDRLAAARRHYWATLVPSRFAFATLDDLAGTVAKKVGEWAAHPDGRNLLLLGPVGTGKTHAALAAARTRALAGDEVKFFPVVELLDHLRPEGPKGAFAALAEVDLLVVDDLGAERPTDWTNERLGALINRRWMEERPTIGTTNLDSTPVGADKPGALEVALGERAYSRMVGSGAVGVRLGGRDRRRRHANPS